MRRTAVLAAAGLASSLGIGCGGREIDQRKAEDYIRSNLIRQGVPRPVVSCPAGVRVHRNRTFECSASSAHQRVVFTLRMLDDRGAVNVVSFRQG